MTDTAENHHQNLSISEAAEYLKVSTKTLRRWEKVGLVNPRRDKQNQRKYSLDQLKPLQDRKNKPLPTVPKAKPQPAHNLTSHSTIAYVSISQAANEIGVSTKTLRRWDDEGLIKSNRNELNHRIFDPKEITRVKQARQDGSFQAQQAALYNANTAVNVSASQETKPSISQTIDKTLTTDLVASTPKPPPLILDNKTLKVPRLSSRAFAFLSITLLILSIFSSYYILSNLNKPASSRLAQLNNSREKGILGQILGITTSLGNNLNFQNIIDNNFNFGVAGTLEGSQVISSTNTLPPLVISSTQRVTNLNADLLDGKHLSEIEALISGSSDLQAAYDQGSTIDTDTVDIVFNMRDQATDADFRVNLLGNASTFNITGNLGENIVSFNPTGTYGVDISKNTRINGSINLSGPISATSTLTLDDANTSGAIAFSDSSNTGLPAGYTSILDVLADISTGGGGLFTDGGTVTYRTDSGDDFAIGGSGLSAAFSVDSSDNTIRVGDGSDANGQITLYASDGDSGSIIYQTSDQFYFSGGNVVLTQDLTIEGGDITGSNGESIAIGTTDDIIAFLGSGGSDNTNLYVNLDGPYPILYSATDTAVAIDDDLTFIGAQTISTTAGNLTLSPSGSFVVAGLNCTGNTNGGALTADASGVISCSDDDSGSSIGLEENDVSVSANVTIFDFLGNDFIVTESPVGEANISIDYGNSSIARTNQAESISGAWSFTNGLTLSGSDINLASNNIVTGATTLSSTELDILDGGILLSELTNSGTLTANTVDLNGGAIDGVVIGGVSAAAGSFTSLSVSSATTLGDANTDTVVFNAGQSGSGISFSDASFQSCTALETDGSGVLVCGTDDTGVSGAVVEEGDVSVVATLSTLDFLAADFNVTESPSNEANVTIDYANSGITRNNQTESISQLWTFNSGLSTVGLTIGGESFSTLTGTGLSLSGTDLVVDLGTSIDSSEIVANTIDFVDISNGLTLDADTTISSAGSADTLTFSNGTILDINGTLEINNEQFSSLTGTGLSMVSNQLVADLGTSIDTSEIVADTITFGNISDSLILDADLTISSSGANDTLTFANGSILDIDGTFEINNEQFSGLTGAGLELSSGNLAIQTLIEADGTGATSSRSGLEFGGTGSDQLTLLQGCNDGEILAWDNTNNVWQCATDATGSGAATVQENDSTVVAALSTLDFLGADFIVADAGSGEADISIDYANSGITRDNQAESISQAWTFNDGLTTTGLTLGGESFSTLTGDGLEINGTSLQLATTTAGNGLTYTTGVLAVGAGNGITVNANDIAINLAANSGLNTTSGLAIDSSLAGTGLTLSSGVLNVGSLTGSELAADTLDFSQFSDTLTLDADTTISGAGAANALTFSDGTELSVQGTFTLGSDSFSSLSGDGLALSGTNLVVDLLDAGSGLTFSGGELTINSAIAGTGLNWSSGVLNVTGLTGSELAADTLDFGQFSDTLTLDADTTISSSGANDTLTFADGSILDIDGTFEINNEQFSGLTGAGLELSSGNLAIQTLIEADGTGATSSRSGLEFGGTGSDQLTLLQGCNDGEILAWDNTNNVWQCATDATGSGAATVQENDSTVVAALSTLDFLGADFIVADAGSGEADISIDYANSGITRSGQDETITGNWTFANNLAIEGTADEIQLRVQGNSTQTTDLFVLEQSDGSDVFTVTNAGNTTIGGSLTFNSQTFTNFLGTGLQNNGGALEAVLGTSISNTEVDNDTLNFAQFSDSLSLDASTSITFGTNNLILNMDSSGDFIIQDNGSDVFTFADNGSLTQALSGQVTFTGNVDATNGLDVTGDITGSTNLDIALEASVGTLTLGSESFSTLTGDGLALSGTNLVIDLLDAGSGLTFSGGELTINSAIAGTGLNWSSGVLNVTGLTGSEITANSLDFSELANSLTLDVDTTINSAGTADKLIFANGSILDVNGTFELNDEQFSSLTGTGLSISGNELVADLGTSISSAEIEANTINFVDISNALTLDADTTISSQGTNNTLTFANGAILDIDGTFEINNEQFSSLTGDGLEINGTSLQLATTTAGNGLTYTTGVLAVGAGNGITVNANDIAINLAANSGLNTTSGLAIDSSLAGTGLTLSSGVLNVGSLTGSEFAADTLDFSQFSDTLTLDADTTISGAGAANALTFNDGVEVSVQGTLTLGADSFSSLTGTGLSLSGNALVADLGTSIDTSEIEANTITLADIANSLTLDSDLTISSQGANDTLTFANGSILDIDGTFEINNEQFSGLTGAGLELSSGNLAIQTLIEADGTGATSSRSGLEFGGTGSDQLTLLQGCNDGEILAWDNTNNVWQCATDATGSGAATVQENDSTVVASLSTLDFLGADFIVADAGSGEADISIDYANSGITRDNQAESISQAWTFNDGLTTTGLTMGGESFSTLTGDGLALSGTNLVIDLLDAGSGLTFSGGELTINSAIAGTGLNWSSGVLNVTGLTGSELAADTLDFSQFSDTLTLDADTTISGAGLANALTFNDGVEVSVQGSFTLGSDTFSTLTGTGLSLSGNALVADLGTSIDTSEIEANTIDFADISNALTLDADTTISSSGANDTLTFANGTILDINGTLEINNEQFSSLTGTGLELNSNTLRVDEDAALTWTSTQTFSGAVDINNTLSVSGDITFDATTPTFILNDGEVLSITDGTNTLLTLTDNGTSATLNANIINATSTLQIGGTDINTGGTLSNLAYLDQANSFTANQSITGGLTVSGEGTFGTLDVTGEAALGSLTINSETFTNLTGAGLVISNGILQADSTELATLLSGWDQNASDDLTTGNYTATLDSVYVNVGESPSAGDITGSFSGGLNIGGDVIDFDNLADALTLDADTTIFSSGANDTLTFANGSILDIDGTFEINNEQFSGLTGAGLELSSGNLAIQTLIEADGTGATSSRSGLEFGGTGSDQLTLLQGCNDGEILAWDNTNNVWQCATDATGSGAATVQENDSTVVASLSTLDFLGADFIVSDAGSGEADISIDYTNSGITRDNQAESISQTWTFNDGLTTTGLTLGGESFSTLTGDGLALSGTNLVIDLLDAGSGLTFSTGELTIDSGIAGTGLNWSSGVLNVTGLTGSELAADTLDFSQFSDTLTLDADTTISSQGANDTLTFANGTILDINGTLEINNEQFSSLTGTGLEINSNALRIDEDAALTWTSTQTFSGAVDINNTLSISGDITFDATTPTVVLNDGEVLSISDGSNTLLTLTDNGSTATLNTNIVNATSALQINGANINTGGTLSNVAYLDQANSFTATQSITGGLTVSGEGTFGSLEISGNAALGSLTLNSETFTNLTGSGLVISNGILQADETELGTLLSSWDQDSSDDLTTANYTATLDSVYVNVGESPSAGDITGSFSGGLNIGADVINFDNIADSLVLDADTTISSQGANDTLTFTNGTILDIEGTLEINNEQFSTLTGTGLGITSNNLYVDTTEIGTSTWGSGSGFTWTFNAGATDPTLALASDSVTLTAGTIALTGNVDVTSGLDVTGNITVTGTVDGRDLATDGSNLDNLYTTIGLSALTSGEVDQLENINSVTISNGQWTYLGSLDQALATTDSPTFAGLTSTGDLDVSYEASVGTLTLGSESFSTLTGDGLALSGTNLVIDLLDAGSGLTFSGGELTINSAIAGTGLNWSSGVLNVTGLTGSELAADTLDFSQFSDTLTLDADTTISSSGANDTLTFANGTILDIDGTLEINNEQFSSLTGTGLSLSGNTLVADLGTSISLSEIDADVIDFSAISDTLTLDADTTIYSAGVADKLILANGSILDIDGTLEINNEQFSGLTGAGLELSSGNLAIQTLVEADGTGATSSRSGLEFGGTGSDQLTLLQGCADGEILAWNDTTNVWACATDNTGGGVTADSLDFTDFADTMTLDADTTISSSGANDTLTFANGTILDIDGTLEINNEQFSTLTGTGLGISSNNLFVDTTEIGTTTWGAGSPFTWTFDAGATDATLAFSSGQVDLTGTLRVNGETSIGSTSATAFTLGDNINSYFTFDGSTDAGDTLFNFTSANSGITSGSLLSLIGDTITTGIGVDLSFDGLTTGTGFNISSTSTGLTTGDLISFDWSPGSATTATGNLLTLNIGANGTIGNILDIQDNGSSVFSVSQSGITSALPHSFTAPGDVTFGYDITLSNQTASLINSYAPLTIRAGESWESNDLTFQTYNSGDFIFENLNNGTIMTIDGANARVGIGTSTPNTQLEVVYEASFGTLTVNSEQFSGLTGAGLELSGTVLAIDTLTEADGTGVTSSQSGLEFGGTGSDQLTLLQGCSDGQILKWDDTSTIWECAADSGGGVTADSLDFTDFSDTMTLDADTTISSQGANDTLTFANGTILDIDGTLEINNEQFSGLTGAGLELSSGNLAIQTLIEADGTGATSSRSGLEFGGTGSDQLTLLQGCSNGQVLAWDDTNNVWQCATGGSGSSAWDDITAPDANLSLNLGTYSTTFTSSATTTNPWTFNADSLTTGTANDISVDALTSGTALNIGSTSTALTTGSLLALDWSATGTNTSTADLFTINVGASDTVSSLFKITDNGSDVFKVTQSQITSAVPHSFTAAGDVSFGYDINLTNQTSSVIESNAPLTIRAGEPAESNNLTLQTYNNGAIIADGKFSLNSQETLGDSTTPSVGGASHFIEANSTNRLVTNFTNGTAGQIIYIEIGTANFDLDCTSSSINCGTTDMTGFAAGDLVSLIYDGTNWNLMGWMDASANNNDNTDGVDLAEYFPASESLEAGQVVSVDETNPVTIRKAQASDGQQVMGIVSTQPGLTLGSPEPDSYPVALVGRVPVKIDPNSDPIVAGDLIGASSAAGLGTKVEAGYIVGRALEAWTSGSGKAEVIVFVNPIFVGSTLALNETGDLILPGDVSIAGSLTVQGTDILSSLDLLGSQVDSLVDQVASAQTTIASLQSQVASLSAQVETDRLGVGVSAPASDSGKLIDTISGAYLSDGGVWTNVSDEAKKENFLAVDSNLILDGILDLDISSWNYIAQGQSVRHLGPTAQDFFEIFGLGENNTSISTIDPAGVALVGIKGLNTKIENYHTAIQAEQYQVKASQTTLLDQVRSLAANLSNLNNRVAQLELVQPNQIQSPLADISSVNDQGDVTIDLPNQANAVIVDGNLEVNQAATISGQLTANQVNTENIITYDIQASNATFGDIIADTIKAASVSAETITGLDEKVDQAVTGRLAILEQRLAEFEAAQANKLANEQKIENNNSLANQPINSATDTATLAETTDSQELTEDFTLPETSVQLDLAADLTDLIPTDDLDSSAFADIDGLFVNDFLAVNGQASIVQAEITNFATIGGNLLVDKNSISTLDDSTLFLQPLGGKLNLLAGLLTLDETGGVKINGDLEVTGLAKLNQVQTNSLTFGSVLGDTKDATGSANSLTDQPINSSTASAQITLNDKADLRVNLASGSALVIGQSEEASTSANRLTDSPTNQSTASITSDGSAEFATLKIKSNSGSAQINAGSQGVIIQPNQLTQTSQVIVTFEGDFAPATRYWITKDLAKGRFTIHLDNRVGQDVNAFWLIIN